MSSNPIPFRSSEKEAPFDAAQIREIITKLLVLTPDEVESEQLEIKGWCRDERELGEKVAEACSCLANTVGGFVFVGVEDGPARRRFSASPHLIVNAGWFQTTIHNQTHPPVDFTPFDASKLLADVLGRSDVNLFVLRVPRTRCISGHVTHKGIPHARQNAAGFGMTT
jgi:hypothetical protein